MEVAETSELRRGALRAKAVLVAMAIVAASAALISMRVLYSAGVSEQRARLMEIASSQAELIDAVARFDAVESQDANPAGAWVATLGQVAGGFASWQRADADVSLSVIGRHDGRIVTHVQDGTLLAPSSTPLAASYPRDLADRALHEAGVAEYEAEGRSWLLAYAPVAALDMGVLVRLDLDVVHRPLKKGLWVSGAASLVLITLGVALLRQTNVQTVQDLSRELKRRVEAESALSKHQADLERTIEERTYELRQAQAKLVDATRFATLGQLTAKVSHELRNPLGTIRTSLHSIREGVSGRDTVIDRALERCERNVTRCNRIIEELLTYTRPKAPRREKVDVTELLSVLLEDYRPGQPVKVEHELDPGVELLIDPEDLRRICVNLLNNAVDATESGEGDRRIWLRLRRVDGSAVVSVEDQGAGMDEEVLTKAFEPLFSTKGFGIGLGLPIVRELTERNGGAIELWSRPGEGTRAVLRFPLGTGVS